LQCITEFGITIENKQMPPCTHLSTTSTSECRLTKYDILF